MTGPSDAGAPTFEECFESLRRQILIKDLAGLGISGERRQAFLAALGTELRRIQTPAVEVLDDLLAANAARNEPPLSEAEVVQVLEVAQREAIYQQHQVGSPDKVTT